VITLAELERSVARRTGPFFVAAQASGEPTSSTATSAIMPALQSNALLGGPENLWLLRRGYLVDGTPTPQSVNDRDRIRMVQTFDPGAGRVTVDRNWQAPMYPNEVAEFMHLHPQQELREAVWAGLRRCFLADTFSAVQTSGYSDTDLTLQAPWLTSPDQVLAVQYGWAKPYADGPFETYTLDGHVMLGGAWGGNAPSTVWVTGLHPHYYRVNGEYAPAGPQEDDDTLEVDLDYAASAAHIEGYHLFPSRMFAAAAGNLQATQEMAAREFSRQAVIWGPRPSSRYGFGQVFSLRSVG
jgi:hypothetical protein